MSNSTTEQLEGILAVKKHITLERKMNIWNSANNSLPNPRTNCLVYMEGGDVRICLFTHDSKWALETLYGCKVTHWIEIPDDPADDSIFGSCYSAGKRK